MKAIQITVDETLLARLDSVEDVKKRGRSAVIRVALDEWLRRREEKTIEAEYRAAYGRDGGLGKEWEGWEKQGTWLDR